jgi:AcrR family transcriptional regulator
MNDIVDESGLSKGAIYGHFESKEKLFLATWERQTTVGIEQLRQMFSPGDTAVDKLNKVGAITMASSCDCPPQMNKMLLEFMATASRMPALEPDMQRRYDTIHAFIAEIFEEGVSSGEFRRDTDEEGLTTILFATLDGLSLHSATLGRTFDSNKLRETLLRTVLHGILA